MSATDVQATRPATAADSGFGAELRISLKPVIAVMLLAGVVLFFVGDGLPDPPARWRMMGLAMLFVAASAIAGGLDAWKSRPARWFAVVALVSIVHAGVAWLDTPGFSVLLVIPVVLAAALIGLPASLITASAQTALLLLRPITTAPGGNVASTGLTLMGIWATLSIMVAVYRPVRQLAEWLAEYFERAQMALEEARDRKAELEQALDDLAHANRQLALASERTAALRQVAEEAQKAKADFVARVSHEFRAPLNMIIGLVGIMVETPEIYAEELPPDLAHDLEIVHRNCEHLSAMINDVLDLSRAEAGRLTLHREQVDLAEAIEGALAAVRPLVEKKRLGLRIALPQDLPPIHGDRTRIRQVVLNLVSNAARFTDAGEIAVSARREGQDIVVSVSDTGPGIAPEDAERIFEPFCQRSNGSWRDQAGSGLGLTICKQIVELHDGRMWMESRSGAGATFFFQLPISPPVRHVTWPGHWIREDWIWRERGFRTDQVGSVDGLVKPRVIICDETGRLHPEFVRLSDEIEFVDVRDLNQARRALRDCPAHAMVLNADVPAEVWPAVETVRREAGEMPIIGCSVSRPAAQAAGFGARGHLTKPVTRGDLEAAIRSAGRPVRRVLAVDDDPHVLRLLARMLHTCDPALEVTTVSSGEEALDELRRTPPDLLLLDIVMPRMDGRQVLACMAGDERIGDVPVFLVSAQDPEDGPLTSPFLLAAKNEGLSISTLLQCSLEFSAHLLKPNPVP